VSFASLFTPAEGTYLLSHSAGRPPLAAREALASGFLTPWECGAGEPWGTWMATVDGFRLALAELLGVDVADLCPQSSLSDALFRLVDALPADRRRRAVLLHEDDFPSMGFALSRTGLELRFMPRSEDPRDPQNWARRMTPDVGLMLITHAQSNTGRCLPVAELCALARASGCLSIIDVAQSAGVLPVQPLAWGADAVIGSSVKWLCGGPGAGFLYVRRDLADSCTPRAIGWFAHAEPFAFDIHDFRDHPGALRFQCGTPSVAPFAIAAAGIRLIHDIGIEAVLAHNRRLTRMLIEAVDPAWVRSPADDAGRTGTVVLDAGPRQQEIASRLRAASVYFDIRPTGMRLSPHVYTSAADMNAVIDCLTG